MKTFFFLYLNPNYESQKIVQFISSKFILKHQSKYKLYWNLKVSRRIRKRFGERETRIRVNWEY